MKSKIVLALLVLFVILIGCQSGNMPPSEICVESSSSIQETIDENVPESSEFIEKPESATQEESSKNEPTSIKSKKNGIPFVIPEVEHTYADEMLQIVQGFSNEYAFPEFEDVKKLPFNSMVVSSNLYSLIAHLNNDLSLPGIGITPEEQEVLLADRKDLSTIVRLKDMNTVGRRFFGKEFSFPKDLICEEIAPLDSNSEYYVWTNARGGMSFFYYLLADVIENQAEVIATFFPYSPFVSWDDGTIPGIDLIDPSREDYYVTYDLGYIEYPNDEAREKADAFSCLQYYYLTVPQEELVTITVTFCREDTGNLIATSCKYNR